MSHDLPPVLPFLFIQYVMCDIGQPLPQLSLMNSTINQDGLAVNGIRKPGNQERWNDKK
jgi:hypothetical protein